MPASQRGAAQWTVLSVITVVATLCMLPTAASAGPKPDIVVTSLSVESNITIGTTAPLQLSVTNSGKGTASSVSVSVTISSGGAGSVIAKQSLGSLRPGAAVTITTTFVAPSQPGAYALTAAATTEIDANLANNSLTKSIAITDPAAPSSTTTPNTVSSTPCDYYASPTGGGNGDSSSSPFKVQNFWPLAAPGRTLCLLDGTYQGSASMVTPPAGVSGASGSPITVRALNDGQALIDGQFTNYPVHLSNGNSWFVFEGFNAKSGAYAVIRNASGSNNNVYRRIVAWDADIRLNASVFYNIASDSTLLEDVALFGTGATLIEHIGNTGGITCRRCWGRWEGSTTNWSHKIAFDMGYELTPNGVCENCLVTASSESMPASFSVTDASGGTSPNANCTSQTTSTAVPCPGPLIRIRSSVSNNFKNARMVGSLVYLRPSDVWNATSGMMTIPTYGADVSGVYVRHVFSYVAPMNPNFGRTWGIDLNQTTSAPTELSADRITSVAGAAPRFTTNWAVGNSVHGTSLAAVPSPWTGNTGAQLCNRWVNGQETTTPLWPWPMNDRIKWATQVAGSYTGPCLNCSGGRAARTQIDVQAEVENLLGSIPAQCRAN